MLSDLSHKEIKELERDYRMSTIVTIGCPLSICMSGRWKESEQYPLLLDSYHWSVLDNKHIDCEDVNRFFSNYIDKASLEEMREIPGWMTEIYISAWKAKKQLIEYFQLNEEQIEIKETERGINHIVVVVPDIGENVLLVKSAL